MTIDELESALFAYKLSEWIQTRLPESEEKIDNILADEWEPFYLRNFKIDHRFPVMGLIKELYT